MRLFEVEDRFGNDLAMVLRNLLGRADATKSSIKLSFEAISNLIKNIGYGGIDYATFNKIYDTNPTIQAMVKDYDESGVELGTEVEKVPEPSEFDTANSSSVKSMARSSNPYI